MDDLRGDLAREIAQKRIVVMVGAGVSIQATDDAPCASWKGLLRHGVDHAKRCGRLESKAVETLKEQIDAGGARMLSAAESIARALGAPSGGQPSNGEFSHWLRESAGKLPLQDRRVLQALSDLDVPIVTTNYDHLLEEVTHKEPLTWRNQSAALRFVRGEEAGSVLHIHGYWKDPESVVLGTSSYQELIKNEHAQAVLKTLRMTNGLLFVGFGEGLEDPNFEHFRAWMASVMSASEARSYRLALNSEVKRLQPQHPHEERVIVLGYGDTHGDLAAYLQQLCPRSGKLSVGVAVDASRSSTNSEASDAPVNPTGRFAAQADDRRAPSLVPLNTRTFYAESAGSVRHRGRPGSAVFLAVVFVAVLVGAAVWFVSRSNRRFVSAMSSPQTLADPQISQPPSPSDTLPFHIYTATNGGSYWEHGKRLAAQFPGAKAEPSAGGIDNCRILSEQAEKVDLAFGYTGLHLLDPEPGLELSDSEKKCTGLQVVAPLYEEMMHILTTRRFLAAHRAIVRIDEEAIGPKGSLFFESVLRGKPKVQLGVKDGTTRVLAKFMLELAKKDWLPGSDVEAPGDAKSFDEEMSQLIHGEADVAFFLSSEDFPALTKAFHSESNDLCLLSITPRLANAIPHKDDVEASVKWSYPTGWTCDVQHPLNMLHSGAVLVAAGRKLYEREGLYTVTQVLEKIWGKDAPLNHAVKNTHNCDTVVRIVNGRRAWGHTHQYDLWSKLSELNPCTKGSMSVVPFDASGGKPLLIPGDR